MRLFQLVRHPTRQLKVLFALFALAVSLNVIAHAAHTHDPAPATAAHPTACGYCIAFSAAADAPDYTFAVQAPAAASAPPSLPEHSHDSPTVETCAHPRAPPAR